MIARNMRVVYNYYIVNWGTLASTTHKSDPFSMNMFIWFAVGSVIFVVAGNIILFVVCWLVSKSVFEKMS